MLNMIFQYGWETVLIHWIWIGFKAILQIILPNHIFLPWLPALLHPPRITRTINSKISQYSVCLILQKNNVKKDSCKSKTIERNSLNNCMSPPRGPCAYFQSRLWILVNSVAYINKAKLLQKSRKQFASRR